MLPYCWNDETPLSNHELRMDDDIYRMRQDPAVTVGLRLETGGARAADLDDDAVDAAVSNLAIDGRPGHRLRRGRVGRHRHPERYLLAEAPAGGVRP